MTKNDSAPEETKTYILKFVKPLVILFVIVLIVLVFNLIPFYTVDQTDIAVIKTFGKVTTVSGPGLQMKIPAIQKVEKYYVGVRTQNFYPGSDDGYPAVTALSSDGLEIIMDISVQTILKKDKIMEVSKAFGGPYDLENWMVSVIRGSVRDVIALYNAEALYGDKRTEVQTKIRQKIEERLSTYFELYGVYLRNVILPPNLKAAIEQKLEAQQEAMKMEYVVQRETLEAQRKAIEAQGIADYTTIISNKVNDKYLEWYYIQTLEKFANGQNGKVILLPSPAMSSVGSASQMPILLNTG